MTFEDWMKLRDLSPSSIRKYDGAIKGPLSDWAMNGSLTECSGQLIPDNNLDGFSAFAGGTPSLYL